MGNSYGISFGELRAVRLMTPSELKKNSDSRWKYGLVFTYMNTEAESFIYFNTVEELQKALVQYEESQQQPKEEK